MKKLILIILLSLYLIPIISAKPPNYSIDIRFQDKNLRLNEGAPFKLDLIGIGHCEESLLFFSGEGIFKINETLCASSLDPTSLKSCFPENISEIKSNGASNQLVSLEEVNTLKFEENNRYFINLTSQFKNNIQNYFYIKGFLLLNENAAGGKYNIYSHFYCTTQNENYYFSGENEYEVMYNREDQQYLDNLIGNVLTILTLLIGGLIGWIVRYFENKRENNKEIVNKLYSEINLNIKNVEQYDGNLKTSQWNSIKRDYRIERLNEKLDEFYLSLQKYQELRLKAIYQIDNKILKELPPQLTKKLHRSFFNSKFIDEDIDLNAKKEFQVYNVNIFKDKYSDIYDFFKKNNLKVQENDDVKKFIRIQKKILELSKQLIESVKSELDFFHNIRSKFKKQIFQTKQILLCMAIK